MGLFDRFIAPPRRKGNAGRFRNFVCGRLGHSRILTNVQGVVYCSRCGADQNGVTGLTFIVNQTCRCPVCLDAFHSLTWRDRWLAGKAEWPTPEFIERKRLADANLAKMLEDLNNNAN